MPSFGALVVLALPLLTAAQFFTVNCGSLTVQRSDPIVSPGQMSGHVHVVIGGTNFKQAQSNQDAINAKATSCDKILDNSNYWIPQLYHQHRNGTFGLVEMQGGAVYYLNRACDYAPGRTNCNGAPISRAPPAGLRALTGNPNRRNYDGANFAHRAISHVCLNQDQGSSTEGPALPQRTCLRMRSQVYFPSCWNGRDLDTADHSSHLAYPAIGDYNTGVCPQSHPIAIFTLFYEFFFETGRIRDFNRWVYAQGDTTGYGLHGDFINGWKDQDKLQRAMTTCTGAQGINDPNCSLWVNGSPGSGSPRTPESAAPNEDVGLKGPIAKLPGNNPVTRKKRDF